MKVFVTGYQKVDFLNQQNERITGVNLFMLVKNEHVVGTKADKKFLSSQLVNALGLSEGTLNQMVSSQVDFDSDLNGRICGFEILEPMELKAR